MHVAELFISFAIRLIGIRLTYKTLITSYLLYPSNISPQNGYLYTKRASHSFQRDHCHFPQLLSTISYLSGRVWNVQTHEREKSLLHSVAFHAKRKTRRQLASHGFFKGRLKRSHRLLWNIRRLMPKDIIYCRMAFVRARMADRGQSARKSTDEQSPDDSLPLFDSQHRLF